LKAEKEAALEAEKAALLEKFDADDDGKLDWEELAAARAAKKAEILEKYDTDTSGDLNEEERAAMMADLCEAKGLPLMGVCVVAPPDGWDGHHHRGGLLGPFGRRLYPCLVIEFDADGDGKLSKEELEAARAAKKAEFLARFDTDGDGELSKEECAAARETLREEAEARRAAKYAELLAEFDSDGDGKLSEEEMAAARAAKKAEILAEFDVDGDGELNEEERAAARAARCAAEDMDEEDEEGESTMAALVLGLEFVRGDANFDGQVEISDAVGVLGFLFLGQTAPLCLDAADANDTGDIDMSDPLTLLWSLFLGGPPLPEPSSAAGEDPTADDLTCEG
jgi:Ca2+-binding EF-hand superfamily protein